MCLVGPLCGLVWWFDETFHDDISVYRDLRSLKGRWRSLLGLRRRWYGGRLDYKEEYRWWRVTSGGLGCIPTDEPPRCRIRFVLEVLLILFIKVSFSLILLPTVLLTPSVETKTVQSFTTRDKRRHPQLDTSSLCCRDRNVSSFGSPLRLLFIHGFILKFITIHHILFIFF